MSLYGLKSSSAVEEAHDYMREFEATKSVIPSWVESFSEQSLFIAEYAESEYTKMMESVGIDELAVYESTGSFVVYEGAKFDGFKTKILKVFENIGKSIKEAYEKVLTFFQKKSDEFKEKVLKKQFGGVADFDFGKIKSTDKLGKIHNGFYDFNGAYESKIKAYAANANSVSGSLKNKAAIDKGTQGEAILSSEDKEKLDEIIANIDDVRETLIKQIAGEDADGAKTVSDLSKNLRKKLLGEQVDVTVDWLKSHQKNLLDELTKYTSTKRSISNAYKEEKKHINDCIKTIKGLKDKNNAKVLAKYVQAEKDTISVLHGCYAVVMDAFKTRYSEYRAVFARAMRVQKKDIKESAGLFSETTQEDLVNEAFDW